MSCEYIYIYILPRQPWDVAAALLIIRKVSDTVNKYIYI